MAYNEKNDKKENYDEGKFKGLLMGCGVSFGILGLMFAFLLMICGAF